MGQADKCAPSKSIGDNLPPYGGQQVEAEAVLVATDYEGLGTPGEPTYLVGLAEGRAILDSVRAASQLPGAGAPGPVVLAGVSQGGGAVLWAAQVARAYAPELDLRGVVAIAPAAELPTILGHLGEPPYNAYLGNLLLASDGLQAGYGDGFNPASYLTSGALEDLTNVAKECADATIARWSRQPMNKILARDPLSIPSVAQVIAENSPGGSDPGVPVFLAQGAKDAEIPPVVSEQLHARYCKLGTTTVRHLYPNADHESVIDAAMKDVLQWIADRDQGKSAPSDC
jgi:pimeloyl-ACP methyl ester carboxylesterase